jgi:hypothetical protein
MARLLLSLLLASTLAGCGGDKKKDDPKRESAEPTATAEAEVKRVDGLTAASRRIACQSLKSDLAIDYYVTPDKLTEKAKPAVEALLKRYQSARYTPTGGSELTSKVKFRVVEMKSEADKATALAEGVVEQTYGEVQGPNSAVYTRAFHGFVIKHLNEKEVISSWPPDDVDALEFFLSHKMREIQRRVDKETVRIGFVSQKDELGVDDPDVVTQSNVSLASIFGEYFPFYKIEPVDLRAGEQAVDGGLRGLIVTQPGKPFSEKELRRIDEFVMLGDKGLLIVASAANLTRGDATMTVTLDRRGLEKLVSGYGFDVANDVLLDTPISLIWPAATQLGQEVRLTSLGMIMPSTSSDAFLDSSFAPFFRVDDLVFPFASPITLHPDRQTSAKQRAVAKTTKLATIDPRPQKTMFPTQDLPAGGPGEQRVIAASLEGEIATAFPEGDNMGIVTAAKSASASRVLFVASSELFANPYIVSGRSTASSADTLKLGGSAIDPMMASLANQYSQRYFRPMIFVFKNSLDWLSGEADMAELANTLKPLTKKAAPAPSASGSAKPSLFDSFK